MKYRIGQTVVILVIVVGGVWAIDAAALVFEAAGGFGQEPAAQEAEGPYRNVQIFGELPPERLRFVMQVYSNILGTNCEHCHVREEWHLDDKPTKETARAMIRMVFSSSQTHFKSSSSRRRGAERGRSRVGLHDA